MCRPDSVIALTTSSLAATCLVLNVFIPGLGTIVNSLKGEFKLLGILLGILQFVTTPIFLIGWLWSILYGVKIANKSKYYRDNYDFSIVDEDETRVEIES